MAIESASKNSAHLWNDTPVWWNETIPILVYKGCSLDLFMVTQTHF